jgi:ribosomal RNA-processing protein 12
MNPTSWNFVPSILSEAIVATKEVNEKARDIAYSHLVAVANKMKAGGISSERVSATWEEHLATISECFTMLTTDLVGTSFTWSLLLSRPCQGYCSSSAATRT